MERIPCLLIGYRNNQFIQDRIQELNLQHFFPIYVFLDGALKGPDIDFAQKCQDSAQNLLDKGEIHFLKIATSNLGQGVAIPQAINWFFQHEEFGLILEDDCQISTNLISFLRKYRSVLEDPEENIAALCASNIFTSAISKSDFLSYFFESWGWATSRDKWKKFYQNDISELDWEQITQKLDFLNFFSHRKLTTQWKDETIRISLGLQNTWALRFTLSILEKGGFCLFPSRNLVLHTASIDSVHVQSTPRWYRKIRLNEYEASNAAILINVKHMRLTADLMYGAGWRSLIQLITRKFYLFFR
jgi:hypothetical protein